MFQPATRRLWFVWTLLFSVTTLLAAANALGGVSVMQKTVQMVTGQSSHPANPEIVKIFGLVYAVFLAVGFVVRKVMLSPKRLFAQGVLNEEGWRMGNIFSWASSASGTGIGLVLGAGNLNSAATGFFAVALGVLYAYRPSTEKLKRFSDDS